jgi:hypothetical protein
MIEQYIFFYSLILVINSLVIISYALCILGIYYFITLRIDILKAVFNLNLFSKYKLYTYFIYKFMIHGT